MHLFFLIYDLLFGARMVRCSLHDKGNREVIFDPVPQPLQLLSFALKILDSIIKPVRANPCMCRI